MFFAVDMRRVPREMFPWFAPSTPLAHDTQVAADNAMEQIATALSEASLRKGETERLKEDLAVNEKATQGRKGDIEQVTMVVVWSQDGGVRRSKHSKTQLSLCHPKP